MSRPGAEALSQRSPRVVAARRLLRRRHRDEAGLFLAEGPQAVREALAAQAVVFLFATMPAYDRARAMVEQAAAAVPIWLLADPALASLAETVTPQGLLAVCRQRHRDDLAAVLAQRPRLVVMLAGVADPGNAGTVLRTADACGAQAVVFTANSVDVYNGKCVRASAGSVFHLDLVRGVEVDRAATQMRASGLRVLAADARGEVDLDQLDEDGRLGERTAWLFGGEAHGLPPAIGDVVDARVKVPMHARAESLNLAAAAAVCL